MKEFAIEFTRTQSFKQKPQEDALEFGKVFTDHMFIMDYTDGIGWHDARIVPYQPIQLDPASMCFHYGQTVFEGLKAYLTKEGKVLLFRPQKNFERLNRSNDRLCIPRLNEDMALEALCQLIWIEKDWIPKAEGTSLYIRPFIIATEPCVGVAASKKYKFIIILSPVGAYYKEGLNPVSIAVESDYVRAVRGGTGEAKTGGNYASSLKAQELAAQDGYSQVLWLDGVEKKYIEEVGSMNVFFKINGEIITPKLNGSILPGITRDSAIQLLKHWGYKVTERRLAMDEVVQAQKEGVLEEIFGTGTAAVISPVGKLFYQGESFAINEGKIGDVSKKLYETIVGIQIGEQEDPFGWTFEVTDNKAFTKAV
ncbi:MAG: branched-chain amino acid aminotransferase [Tuberibacillus sp.]